MTVRLGHTNCAPAGEYVRYLRCRAYCGHGARGRRRPNPTSAANPFFGSVTAQPRTDETLKLSLDDAVSRGLKNNLGLKQAENDEETVHADKNQALQQFLPTITLTGDTGFYQHDLAAQGFGPGVIQEVHRRVSWRTMPDGNFADHERRPYAGPDPLQPDAFLRVR